VPQSTSIQASETFTVEAWIYAEMWQNLLYKGTVLSNFDNSSTDNGFDLRAGANGQAEFSIIIGDQQVVVTTPELMELKTWYHLSAVYNGSLLNLYINGDLAATKELSGTINAFTGNLNFASAPAFTGRMFNGKIDEVRIWNTVRTISEIRNNINASFMGNESGLVAYWKMDENSGSTIADATSNANNGTLNNMDETAWSENFTCWFNEPDMEIKSLLSPSSGNNLTATEAIKIKLKNNSIADFPAFSVAYTINDGTPVTENISEGLSVLEELDFTFSQTADLSEYGSYIIKVYTTYESDVNHNNDTLKLVIQHYSEEINYALDFDGINDYVQIPHNEKLMPTTALTLEAWINANAWADQAWAGTIIGKDGDTDNGQGGTDASGYVLRCGANGTASFVATADGWNEIVSAPLMKTGKWYHLAAVYNGSSIKLYINGVLQSSKAATSAMTPNDFDVYLGECPGFNGRRFNGKIDEVRIWDIARSEEELVNNMNTRLSGNEAGLVAYYPLNEGSSSTTIQDVSLNAFNGNLSNMDPETDWVNGFEPMSNDIGIAGLVTPVNSNEWTHHEKVTVKIKNFGFNAVSNFDIVYILNDGQEVRETYTGSVPARSTVNYTFETPVNIALEDEVEINLFTDFTDDNDVNNDEQNYTVFQNDMVSLMDKELHNFGNAGQTHRKTVYLPQDVDKYEQILLYIDLNCPTYGCDPWDQAGNIKVKKDGMEYEIGRFVTPYGKACGPWAIDVTDFKSILQGEIELTSYIQVWGASGWLVSLDLEYIEGETVPENKYSKIDYLWNTDYQVYGDPNISYDQAEIATTIESQTKAAHIRLTTTGHGQGNTNNAAEFSEMTHYIWVDGSETFEQHLWKDDCNQNPCSPQNGTWQHSRAGWCPGQEVTPNTFNLENYFTPGEDIMLDYVLQDYTNELNTGYNSGSHTEPYYRIHGFIISESNAPYTDITDIGVSNINSPVSGSLFSDTETVSIDITNYGTLPISNFDVGFYTDLDKKVKRETVDQTIQPGETITYTFTQTANLSGEAFLHLFAGTFLNSDKKLNNDFSYVAVNDGTGFEDSKNDFNIKLIPNPNNGIFSIKTTNDFKIETVSVYSVNGMEILNKEAWNPNRVDLDLTKFGSGMYFINVKTNKGYKYDKVIIQ